MPLKSESRSTGESNDTVLIGLNAVIVAVTDEEPRLLTVQPPGHLLGQAEEEGRESAALPFGPLDPEKDRTLELGLTRWVREQTDLELGYVEQLYTFGDRDREPRGSWGGRRVLSVGYLALVREAQAPSTDGWRRERIRSSARRAGSGPTSPLVFAGHPGMASGCSSATSSFTRRVWFTRHYATPS
jgi:hypothetical protein